MPGRKPRSIPVRRLLGCILVLLFSSTEGFAASIRLSAPDLPPGGIAGLAIRLSDTDDAPVALVARLGFDVAQARVLTVERGPAAGDGMLEYHTNTEGVTLIVYGGSSTFEAGTLATVFLELARNLPLETTVTIGADGSSAADRAGEGLDLTLMGTTLAVRPLALRHHADLNANGRMELNEVLRVVQLYRLGPIYCDEASEDGYSTGEGNRDCTPYMLDYAPQDWRVGLSELLRCIQFFNAFANAFHVDETSEDGFAPGPLEVDDVG